MRSLEKKKRSRNHFKIVIVNNNKNGNKSQKFVNKNGKNNSYNNKGQKSNKFHNNKPNENQGKSRGGGRNDHVIRIVSDGDASTSTEGTNNAEQVFCLAQS